MTEEYIDERERDLLDYFRNNLVDSENRGVSVNETHTATDNQEEITLNNKFVKNVADVITVNAVNLRKGYDFTVKYGEGKNPTIVHMNTPLTVDDVVVIPYYYGKALIEREFSRSDVLLPRLVMHFLTGSEDYAGLGDYIDGERGSYFNASFNIEVRDKFASRTRNLASKAFNIARKMRHAGLFRQNISRAYNLTNMDFDPEKDAYIWIFTIDIQWEIMF